MTERDPHRLLASLAHQGVKLELTTANLCFLTALHLRAEANALASFTDEELVDLYEQACELVDPGAENPRKRATNAIQQLREQRFLARVDGAGIARTGEYALTRLAAGVVEFFIMDEALTRESLTLLTTTLKVHLAEVLAAAKKCDGEESWKTKVVGPLRVTVGDLVAGIDRRQKGLDSQQMELQAQIAALLQESWYDAIEKCQSLLDTTTGTLRELNEILLRDAHHFVAMLQEIQALAEAASRSEVFAAAQRVIEHVDRMRGWGAARQRAWSEYYQHVHRYLRDVVRLDPGRALSQRLRERITAWTANPHHVVVAATPSIRLMRDVAVPVERPPATRPKVDREKPLEMVASDDLVARLEVRVRELIESGAADLVMVTQSALELIAPTSRYAMTGQVAELVAKIAATHSEHERPWRPIDDNIEIEDWRVLGPRRSS